MNVQTSSSTGSCDATEKLRKRTCMREACCATTNLATDRCCDDDCLIEIARRDCKHEHSSVVSESIVAEEEPCGNHLARAKAAYGELLINIGCICNTLLSLNLESCCTTKTTDLRRTASWRSEARELLSEMNRMSNDGSSVSHGAESKEGIRQIALTRVPATGAEDNIDKPPASLSVAHAGDTKPLLSCSTNKLQLGCCTQSQKAQTALLVDQVVKVKDRAGYLTDIEGENCCNNLTTQDVNAHEVPASCNGQLELPRMTNAGVSACDGGCCPSLEDTEYTTAQPSKSTLLLNDVVSTSKSTCGGSQHKCSNVLKKEKIPNLRDGCCIDQQSKPLSAAIDSIQIDVGGGNTPAEHIVISVQGMTCTGCEINLYKTLIAIPGVKNVKTSLVLARAECDVSATDHTSVVDIVKHLERKTGFNCALLGEAGYYLDLVVENAEEYSNHNHVPKGVSAIEILDNRMIRVEYSPEVIGARDLLCNPFFRLAALAPICQPPVISSGRKQLWRMLFKTILSVILTIPVLVMAWARLPPHEVTYGAISLVLATIVQVYIAGPWYISAFRALVYSRLIEVDFLVVLSSSAAYLYSIIAYGFLVAGAPLSTEGFFETSTLLVTLIMLGRLVTTLARQRAVESITIESLQPASAILVDENTALRTELDSRLLQFGDSFLCLPDTSIVTDGIVISGTSEVDESMITGESIPVLKRPGSSVVAGSINHSGTLTVRLTRLTANNSIKTIGLMVDEAKSSKARFQELADRVAGVFVPIILAITIIVFAIWIGVGKVNHGYSASQTCINAMAYAIAALIVSCPCAIGLAVPMVLVIAGGVAAKHGVIFQCAETIEKARNVTHVVFDKTGTLTKGEMRVVEERFPNQDKLALMPLIYDLCSTSKHPVSSAITEHLGRSDKEKVSRLCNIKSLSGFGIEADWGDDHVRVGSAYWLSAENLPAVKQVLSKGLTVCCVTVNKGLVAVFGLQDTLQQDTEIVISELQRRNIEISIISGDNEKAVSLVATRLGVPSSNIRARYSPGDKQNYIKSITSKDSTVLFCGDGTNDAIALAEAAIGMHVSGGTDIAKSAADAVLIRPNLKGIIVLMDLSQAFYRRVVLNFVWSFVYNAFAILLAAGAFPKIRIEPQYAGLGEIVSVLPVIAIGVQLRWARFTKI